MLRGSLRRKGHKHSPWHVQTETYTEKWISLMLLYHCSLGKQTSSHLLLPCRAQVSYWHLLPVSDFWHSHWFLTQRQFEARVEQHQVKSGIFGATDLIISHDDLRVQCEPLSRALLRLQRHFIDELDVVRWAIVSKYAVEAVSSKPHSTVGYCGEESTQCPPWCPRLTLCSTPLLSDPDPGDWFHWTEERQECSKLKEQVMHLQLTIHSCGG